MLRELASLLAREISAIVFELFVACCVCVEYTSHHSLDSPRVNEIETTPDGDGIRRLTNH